MSKKQQITVGQPAVKDAMKERELVMKVTKEIVVKFVEMGRVTPASFNEVFSMVHDTVRDAMGKS